MLSSSRVAPLTDEQLEALRQQLDCSVCLSLMRQPCTLVPCGHAVDARCALDVWQRAPARPLLCVVCRAPTFLLLPAYALKGQCELFRAHQRALRANRPALRNHADRSDGVAEDDDDDDDDDSDFDEWADDDPAEVRRVELAMRDYNRRFSAAANEGPLRSLITSARLGFDSVRNVALLPAWHQVLVVLALTLQVAYFIWPYDLLPEAQFGMILGMLDDFLFFLLLVIALGLVVRSIWNRQ